MTRSNLPKSIRKHIRLEKARIRRAAASPSDAEAQVAHMLARYRPAARRATVGEEASHNAAT